MKILLISPLPPPVGGISRWTQIMLQSLKKDEHTEVMHINSAPKYTGKNTLIKRILFGIISVFSIYIEAYRELKKGIDVVHITSSGSLALFRDRLIMRLAKRHSAATVLHLHFGRIPQIAKAHNSEWKSFVKLFSLCDAVIAIDRETENALKDYGYAEKTHYCPNPIDVLAFKQYCDNKTTKKKVVFIGHIYREKGIGELVDAWMSIHDSYPEYTLEFVGSTSDKVFVKSLPKDLSIRLVGEKTHEETMKLLSEATMLVLPSYTEGFPNVILEAMALKVPIIATDVGAIPEMLADGCGILIKPKNIKSIKDAILKLLYNSEMMEHMANKAYDRVVEQYDVYAVVSLYNKVWRTVADE